LNLDANPFDAGLVFTSGIGLIISCLLFIFVIGLGSSSSLNLLPNPRFGLSIISFFLGSSISLSLNLLPNPLAFGFSLILLFKGFLLILLLPQSSSSLSLSSNLEPNPDFLTESFLD